MLSAPTLRHNARLLTSDAGQLWEQAAWVSRGWSQFHDAGFRGEGADAAIARLGRLSEGLNSPPGQMVRVASVLSTTAGLQEHLDQMRERVLGAIGTLSEHDPSIQRTLTSLRMLGEALDWACARQIGILCADGAGTLDPGERLADLPDLPIDAVHELRLLTAPPHLSELAEANPDLRLLEASDGRLVAAIGDIDTSESVTTVVAGVSSSDPAGWATQVTRARAVAGATGGAAVLWLGYPAPSNAAEALNPAAARMAGPQLRGFQEELARRHPGQRRIVVGYSYGSVVVGNAARSEAGLHADDVVLVGSPGAGVSDASQLRLLGDAPRVHAMTNPGDIVGWAAGVQGPDPTSPGFGAEVWPGTPSGDHSSYWEDPHFLDKLRGLSSRS
ncbi:hypothetical protein CATRI_12080 [Corynebacterium atrinae]|uniref:alpha/beta hydrolase n=1 Tax=Corynebacterium atrinae TaxID=1336740 RepID=UPI0025B3DFD9|nr:alpha/beta hydrolase [Corynebacterium atrinae]WJY64465.1 hypothetical protein CATRI_12080 [Corynebacterium atrinae]